MKKVMWAFLVFTLVSIPAHADKWATGTYYTSSPIDQVFEQTESALQSTKWYFTGVRSPIQSVNREKRTIHSILVRGEQWGDIWVTMTPQGPGTSIEAVVRLRSDAMMSASTYAKHFEKIILKKLFPDVVSDIKNGVVPDNFTFGVDQVSIPLDAASAPVIQPMQNPTGNLGTTVIQQPIPLVLATVPAVQPPQSPVISPAQVNSIDNSLHSIATSLSQQTTGVTPSTAAPVIPMQNNAPAQIQQMGEATQHLGNSLMMMGAEEEIIAARNAQQADETATRNAVNRFLSKVNPVMNRYLATSGSDATGKFEMTAKAINQARDETFITLSDPAQKKMFTRVTNEYMVAIGRRMGDHVREQASANRESNKEQYTENLHRALDSWYANGKDWSKIPSELWSKLTERDKGRIKDGIDPEMIGIQAPLPQHVVQP